MMSGNLDFFNNLEDGASENEHPQSLETEESEKDQTSSEEEYSDSVGTEEETDDTEDTAIEDVGGEEDIGEVEEKKFAGRFKTVEDLEKAYKSLEGTFTKKSQQLNEVLGNLQNAQQNNQYMPLINQNQIPQELANHPQFQQLQQTNPQEAARVAQQYLYQQQNYYQQQEQQSKMQQLALNQEILSLKSRYKDFEEVAAELPVVFFNNPWLWKAKNPVETAYKLTKAEKLDDVISATVDATKKEINSNTQKKKAAITEKQRAKTPTKEITPEDEIVKDIFDSKRGGNAFF